MQKYVTKLYGTEKENYNVEIKLLSEQTSKSKNMVCMNFQVISSFNYVECDFASSYFAKTTAVVENTLQEAVWHETEKY